MKQIIVRNQHYGWDLLLILFLVAVTLTAVAHCAEPLPNAPELQHQKQVWTRPLITATAVHGAIRIADDVQTCQHLANGGHEYGFPTQSCAGVVAMNSAVYAGITFVSWELAKHGHRKMAVWMQYIGAGTDAAALLIPRQQPQVQP